MIVECASICLHIKYLKIYCSYSTAIKFLKKKNQKLVILIVLVVLRSPLFQCVLKNWESISDFSNVIMTVLCLTIMLTKRVTFSIVKMFRHCQPLCITYEVDVDVIFGSKFTFSFNILENLFIRERSLFFYKFRVSII